MLLILPGVAQAKDDGGHIVTVLRDSMDVLYLKVSNAYVGASLTVFDANGSKVMEMEVSSKKILIDFVNEQTGDYVVHVEKGGFQQDLKYHKV